MPDYDDGMIDIQAAMEKQLKEGSQVHFRLSLLRNSLGVDVAPTQDSIIQLAEFIQAEVEVMVASKADEKVVKVKSMKPTEQSGQRREGEKKLCVYFAGERGCRMGRNCNYSHDWSVVEKKADRCWICGSLQHRKGECPVKHEAAGRNGFRQQQAQGESQQQNKSQQPVKPKVAAEKGVAEDAKEASGSGGAGRQGKNVQELLTEATGLLKSLSIVKVIRVRSVKVEEEFYGLLDGGATHALRQAREGELKGKEVKEVTVELAAGTARLWQHKNARTLLSAEKVEPIVPLAGLVEMGYGISWNNKGCVVKHPVKGDIKVEMKNGCPMVPGKEALRLIGDLEQFHLNRAKICRLSSAESMMMEKWRARWPEVPVAVWEIMGSGLEMVDMKGAFKQDFHKVLPWNRRARRRVEQARGVVLHLFSGKDQSFWQDAGEVVLCLDLQKGQDALNPAVKAYLFQLCMEGKVTGVVGGPPCRSVSVCRYQRPGPEPLRSRGGGERFGLKGLAAEAQMKTHQDSALWLLPMVLFEVTRSVREERGWTGPAFVQENPRDPDEWLGAGEAEYAVWEPMLRFGRGRRHRSL